MICSDPREENEQKTESHRAERLASGPGGRPQGLHRDRAEAMQGPINVQDFEEERRREGCPPSSENLYEEGWCVLSEIGNLERKDVEEKGL